MTNIVLCVIYLLLVLSESILQKVTGRVWFGEGGIIPWRDFGVEL